MPAIFIGQTLPPSFLVQMFERIGIGVADLPAEALGDGAADDRAGAVLLDQAFFWSGGSVYSS